jgi:hypothetical protein
LIYIGIYDNLHYTKMKIRVIKFAS